MLHVLEGLAKKKPAINITKAVNKQLAEEQSKYAFPSESNLILCY